MNLALYFIRRAALRIKRYEAKAARLAAEIGGLMEPDEIVRRVGVA